MGRSKTSLPSSLMSPNTNPMTRIDTCFEQLKNKNRAGFIPFIMAGDPDYETSLELLKKLPEAGADIIELGVCFTDPMADGQTIQQAGLRALDAGQTLAKTLQMVRAFREGDQDTPIILMGYYNPVYSFGVEKFLNDAKGAGVDGLIIVDLPPEEDEELCLPARQAGLDFIRLATPTTDAARLPLVIKNTSGFVYYVSVAGVTGGNTGATPSVQEAVSRIKTASGLPVAVGFGVKTPEKARETAKSADAVVVGSALIEELAKALDNNPENRDNVTKPVIDKARLLAEAVHSAR